MVKSRFGPVGICMQFFACKFFIMLLTFRSENKNL